MGGPLLSLDNLLQSDWNEVMLYHLTAPQRQDLMIHPSLDWERCSFLRGRRYEHLSNVQDELALVLEGVIFHELKGRKYQQSRDDLLVIPKGIVHSAEMGNEEDCMVFAYYRR